ncbi:hypothetical protein H2199_005169 [Coniosporium tulheliwenetii]|uniref:Uncharacterized protein n=1 Tax=Coniosporium tulheliwenetii TaxID=3383036 RepID=A0ACC2Z340_9PEZI|nr:hypothetical protein H2199_005169 [Cladosporium sp. JES 115]
MATYLYKPLDPSTETHLLTTELGEWGEDIVCRLTHISISEPPEYRALSYVWGNSVIGPPNNIDHELDGEFFVLNYLMEHPRDPISNVEKVRVRDAIDHSIIKTRPRLPRTIIVDGVKVTVGGELFCALRRLRNHQRLYDDSGKDHLMFWVDAVYSQDDIEERNKHVKSMGRIYANAKRVMIWLGDEVSDSERAAFKAIQAI